MFVKVPYIERLGMEPLHFRIPKLVTYQIPSITWMKFILLEYILFQEWSLKGLALKTHFFMTLLSIHPSNSNPKCPRKNLPESPLWPPESTQAARDLEEEVAKARQTEPWPGAANEMFLGFEEVGQPENWWVDLINIGMILYSAIFIYINIPYTPEDERLEHFLRDVCFRSFSFPNGWFGGSSR